MNLRLLALSLVAIVAVACSQEPTVEDGGKLKVVTTFTVIADIAANVAGDAAIVESVTRPNAEIHNYQPTPGDLLRAQGAGLILWNGLNLELWFEKFFQNLKDVQGGVVYEGVEPMIMSEGRYTALPDPHAWLSR